MALSEYVGRPSPTGGATVVRVAPHSHWRPGRNRTEPCAHCGEELDLASRHVLVEVEDEETGETDRLFFQNERCLDEWFEG
ncbi:hypothetical protein [Haloarchaeobius amylolyticus]|uniref:hypothetical protein n=1 Tax=Haloarchaeobius amylolyticus TaxID=1198296 RepID=UPI0022703E4D|nr:hypothetical protein [Haloarchaeobius amylolyticus]